jgi:type VI secretion system secreted protein Hcp
MQLPVIRHPRVGRLLRVLAPVLAVVLLGGTFALAQSGQSAPTTGAPGAICPPVPDLSGGRGRVDAFADIDGIPGESVNARHADEIDVFSLSWCVTNAGNVGGGGGAGRPTFDNLVLGKHTDLATVPLVQAAATGSQIQTAVITLERAGATPFAFLVIELQDVRVTRVNTGWEGNQPDEQVSLAFAEVCWEYRSQDATGAVGETRRFCFDVQANQAG